MKTLDHSTLVTATGGHGASGASPPFVPERAFVASAPRWPVHGGDAAVDPARLAPMPASWWRSYR